MTGAMVTDKASISREKSLDGAVAAKSPDRPFKFGSMSSASAIRFDPDTTDRHTTPRLGSQSSLTSTMTPDGITLTIKHAAGKNEPFSTDTGPLTGASTEALSSEASLPAATSNATKQMSAGSLIDHDSMIEVSQPKGLPSAPYQASHDGKKLIGKLTTQYVMPDGSVITGKGLGRGRPGVKRGPRKFRAPGEESVEGTPPSTLQLSRSSETPVGGKRKRADSDASNIRAQSISSSTYSRESSVEYNPTATQTRSGRQTQRPVSIAAPDLTPSATASPASKKVLTPTFATPALKTHPKIKRKIYRGKEQFALCEHCLRGFGPPGNVIVFCDACNKCWHQRCHQAQIPKEIVADAKAEWFCATCDKILHGTKKSKKPAVPKPEVLQAPPPPPPEQKFGLPMVGAIALTLEQRQKFLESLSREKLIGLLLRAGDLAPQMPIFETPIPLPRVGPHVQPQFTSNYVTPVTTTAENMLAKTNSNDVPDEGYDDTYDEHAMLYPKVGEGVQLPPERDDLSMLLEGPESRTFSHWVKGSPVKTTVDTVPLHLSWPEYAKMKF